MSWAGGLTILLIMLILALNLKWSKQKQKKHCLGLRTRGEYPVHYVGTVKSHHLYIKFCDFH